MKARPYVLLPALFWLALVSVCLKAPPVHAADASALTRVSASSAAIVTKKGDTHSFSVEVMSTPDELARGLMYRTELAPDAGMLFDFGRPQPIAMWMKDTFISLDMLFIGQDGVVLGVAERAVPQSTRVIRSPGPVRAVLEVNGGTAQRLGLGTGDRVVHPMFGSRF